MRYPPPCTPQVWRLFQLTRDPGLLLSGPGPVGTAGRVLLGVSTLELAMHLAMLPWMAQEVGEKEGGG